MTHEVVRINTPFIKLSAFLKFCGAADTGGKAKDIITSGKVLVDGKICLVSGKKLYPGAVVGLGDVRYEVAVG